MNLVLRQLNKVITKNRFMVNNQLLYSVQTTATSDL